MNLTRFMTYTSRLLDILLPINFTFTGTWFAFYCPFGFAPNIVGVFNFS